MKRLAATVAVMLAGLVVLMLGDPGSRGQVFSVVVVFGSLSALSFVTPKSPLRSKQ